MNKIEYDSLKKTMRSLEAPDFNFTFRDCKFRFYAGAPRLNFDQCLKLIHFYGNLYDFPERYRAQRNADLDSIARSSG